MQRFVKKNGRWDPEEWGCCRWGVATGEDQHQRPDYAPTERESWLDIPDTVKSCEFRSYLVAACLGENFRLGQTHGGC